MIIKADAVGEPPLVEVWHTHPSGTTAGFAGYGTLVEARIVALHQPLAAPAGERTRTARTGPAAGEQLRVRCRIRHPRVTIATGVLIPASPDYPDVPPAVFLDLADAAPAAAPPFAQSDFPWPPVRGGGNTTGEILAYLSDRTDADPAGRPATGPGRGRNEGEFDPPPPSGIRPPWCLIWPACPGCGG